MKKLPIVICALTLAPLTVCAQGFSSGSTGANGALDLATMNCPNDVCVVQLPESGILNYTTVSVPSGRTLKFKSNSRNTPVILLAQGNVMISGEVKLDASGIVPGPGGFYGGQGGQPGFGPGGGTDSSRQGKWIGPLSLVPIIGGSGGASADYFGSWYPGGGGGGAIVIASSTAITVTGNMTASGFPNAFNGPAPGGGSGGAIRLVANSLTVSGSLAACMLGTTAACGVVRLEATSLTFTGNSSPAAVLSPINPAIYSSALPQLTISSVGGFSVPSYAGSRFDTVDLLLPSQLSDPINVVVHATNIPTGTQVVVGFVAGATSATSAPGALSGTFESSTATCTVSNLNRNGVTYLLATAIFDPPAGAMNFNLKGSDNVAKIRIESGIGMKPKFFFLRRDGTLIDQAKLPKKFLEQLGL